MLAFGFFKKESRSCLKSETREINSFIDPSHSSNQLFFLYLGYLIRKTDIHVHNFTEALQVFTQLIPALD